MLFKAQPTNMHWKKYLKENNPTGLCDKQALNSNNVIIYTQNIYIYIISIPRPEE